MAQSKSKSNSKSKNKSRKKMVIAAAPSSAGDVAIVGGGLAGMTAALELVRMGVNVRLFESSNRLGGKAGSDRSPPILDKRFSLDHTLSLPAGVLSDHGYHVFPQWYTNMRKLWAEIGITPADEYRGKVYVELPPAIDGQQQAYGAGERPNLRQLLGICELVLQPDELVDDLTLQGFLYSRDFHREKNPIGLNELILNALTIGEARISSRCARDVFRQWVPVITEHNWNALRGSLQTVLIDRLEQRIRDVAAASGAQFSVHMGHQLTRLWITDQGNPALDFSMSDTHAKRASVSEASAVVVMCIPFDRLRTLLDPKDFEAVPEVPAMHNLRANTFSALDIHFEQQLPVTHPEHFRLQGSPYRVTGFEISQHWPELASHKKYGSVMQFVMSDSKRMEDLDDVTFTRVLAKEISRYIPEVGTDAVKFYVPHRNTDAPLFINEVGTWKYRPTSRSKLPGLYFAGDYVQNETDVASMEGAVRTGFMAAEAVRFDHVQHHPPIDKVPPSTLSAAGLALAQLYLEDPVLSRLNLFAGLAARFAEDARTQAESAVQPKPTGRTRRR